MNKWNERTRGQFRKSHPCDACGKPIGTDHVSDTDVCGVTDGPGFYLCSRKRCEAKREALTVEERRALYEATRASSKA